MRANCLQCPENIKICFKFSIYKHCLLIKVHIYVKLRAIGIKATSLAKTMPVLLTNEYTSHMFKWYFVSSGEKQLNM